MEKDLKDFQLIELLDIKSLLPDYSDKSDEDKEAASESLEVIETEVISPKPRKSMIKTAMASLQAIKGTAEFGAAVAALIQFVGSMLS